VTLVADRVVWKTFQFRADGAPAGQVGVLWDFVRQSGFELGALRLTAIQAVGSNRYQVEWSSTPGTIYELMGSDRLGGAETLITTITATNSLTRATVLSNPTVPQGFYRVRHR
jgi:hypothetical protein